MQDNVELVLALERYEASLRDAGAAVANRLRPGASPEAFDAAEEQLGVGLPRDVRTI